MLWTLLIVGSGQRVWCPGTIVQLSGHICGLGITPITQFHSNFSFKRSIFQSMESRGHLRILEGQGEGVPAQLLPGLQQ